MRASVLGRLPIVVEMHVVPLWVVRGMQDLDAHGDQVGDLAFENLGEEEQTVSRDGRLSQFDPAQLLPAPPGVVSESLLRPAFSLALLGDLFAHQPPKDIALPPLSRLEAVLGYWHR